MDITGRGAISAHSSFTFVEARKSQSQRYVTQQYMMYVLGRHGSMAYQRQPVACSNDYDALDILLESPTDSPFDRAETHGTSSSTTNKGFLSSFCSSAIHGISARHLDPAPSNMVLVTSYGHQGRSLRANTLGQGVHSTVGVAARDGAELPLGKWRLTLWCSRFSHLALPAAQVSGFSPCPAAALTWEQPQRRR